MSNNLDEFLLNFFLKYSHFFNQFLSTYLNKYNHGNILMKVHDNRFFKNIFTNYYKILKKDFWSGDNFLFSNSCFKIVFSYLSDKISISLSNFVNKFLSNFLDKFFNFFDQPVFYSFDKFLSFFLSSFQTP